MQPTGPSDPPDPPAPAPAGPGAGPPDAAPPAAPAPAFAPFFVPPAAPSAPAWPASAASGHDPSWAAPHAPPPLAPPPPGYAIRAPGAPDGPRWIPSSALPPGYEPDTGGGQPDVVLFFRLYAGLACLAGAGAACWGLYEGVQAMHRGGIELIGPVFYGIVGTIAFAVYLLGVILPRRPWMHTVAIIQLGFGILGNCCTWPVVVPLLIYWLKPEVKRWFDEGAPGPGD